VSAGPLLHRLELLLRQALGWLLAKAQRVILVRLDNRVGEALLLTPLVSALAGRFELELLVHPKCVRVLEGLPRVKTVTGFERRWLRFGPFGRELRRLRRWTRGAVVVNAANWAAHSGTAAVVSRLISPRSCVVGPVARPGGLLMDVAVPPRADTDNEVLQRLELLRPLLAPLGAEPEGRLGFRTPRPSVAVEAFAGAQTGPWVVVNPGGRLTERRVPSAVFSAACRWLIARGFVALVTWGPGEELLAAGVLAGAPGAVQAPPTSLDELAWLMQRAAVVLCNNTGPMHLSVAVGAPTVALFYRMPPSRWGHAGPAHRTVDLSEVGDGSAMEAAVVAALASALSSPGA
jgi:heptosyltransferase-3